MPADEYDHVPHIAAPLMPALGGLFGILMALTLASEAGYLKSAQDDGHRRGGRRVALGVGSDQSRRSTPMRSTWRWSSTSARHAPTNGTATPPPKAIRGVAVALASLERAVRTEAARSEIGSPGEHRAARLARRPHDEPPRSCCRGIPPAAVALRAHTRHERRGVDRQRRRRSAFAAACGPRCSCSDWQPWSA